MRIPSNKITDVRNFFKQELKNIYAEAEINEFIFLSFEQILEFSRTDLSLRSHETMSESELLKFNNIVKELKKQKPIQYILGSTTFYGLDFFVNENVLIPRPETEELVDLIIQDSKLKTQDSRLQILDIGTGSGCIAIALKKNIPNSNVCAMDISEKALEVAKRNTLKNNTKINLIHADILNSSTLQLSNSPTHFHIIVSNPPYIASSEKINMQKNVLDHEPGTALFVEDSDPLVFYRFIAEYAQKHLTRDGKLFFEINEKYGDELAGLLQQKAFKNILLKKDINDKNRILCCSR